MVAKLRDLPVFTRGSSGGEFRTKYVILLKLSGQLRTWYGIESRAALLVDGVGLGARAAMLRCRADRLAGELVVEARAFACLRVAPRLGRRIERPRLLAWLLLLGIGSLLLSGQAPARIREILRAARCGCKQGDKQGVAHVTMMP